MVLIVVLGCSFAIQFEMLLRNIDTEEGNGVP